MFASMSEEIKNHKGELSEVQMGVNCQSEIYLAMQVGISSNQINCIRKGENTGLGLI